MWQAGNNAQRIAKGSATERNLNVMRSSLGSAYLIMAIAVAMLGEDRPGARAGDLNVVAAIPVASVSAQGIATPTKCDVNGDVALRVVLSDSGVESVTKVSADGHKAVTFRLPTDGKPESPQLVDFAPMVGGLYAVVIDKAGKPWLLEYGEDGRLEHATPLQMRARPMQIDAAIPGELLISGALPAGQEGNGLEPFLGAFNTGGDLLREITPGTNTEDAAKGGHQPSLRERWDAVTGARLQAEANGTIYLLRRSDTGPVFIMFPSGEVRQILLHPPEGAVVSSRLAVSGGRFVVEFLNFKAGGSSGELDRVTLQVIDSASGSIVMNLSPTNPDIGPSLACYKDNEFVFVNTDDKSHLELVKAKPRFLGLLLDGRLRLAVSTGDGADGPERNPRRGRIRRGWPHGHPSQLSGTRTRGRRCKRKRLRDG